MARWTLRGMAAGAAAIGAAPLGYRIGAVPLGLTLPLLAAGLLAVVFGVVYFGVRIARGAAPPDRTATAVLVAAATVGAFPLWALVTGRGAPPIHDITTDTGNPPAFVAAAAHNAPGRTDYGGEAVAAQQRAAFPDLQPVNLPAAPAEAFRRALAVVERMGWEVLAADPAALRIEATDRSLWFGFADDIVVRVTPAGENGSRIDVRSLSRVGIGDLGVNARRVQAFVDALTEP